MHSSDWSLVFFTLLGQFSLGLLLSSLLVQHCQNNRSTVHSKALYIATGSMVLALLISFLHLSSPLASVFALSNLKSSWLSREILMVSLFAGLLVLSSFLQTQRPQKNRIQTSLQWTAAFFGLLMIWSMARIYMLPTVPAWNTPATLLAFYGSAALTGSAFLTLMMSAHGHHTTTPENGHIKWTVPAVLATGLLLKIAAMVFFAPVITTEEVAFAPQTLSSFWISMQWIALTTGFVIIFLWQLKGQFEAAKYRLLPYLGFLLILVAEIISRSAFYMSFFRTGI